MMTGSCSLDYIYIILEIRVLKYIFSPNMPLVQSRRLIRLLRRKLWSLYCSRLASAQSGKSRRERNVCLSLTTPIFGRTVGCLFLLFSSPDALRSQGELIVLAILILKIPRSPF